MSAEYKVYSGKNGRSFMHFILMAVIPVFGIVAMSSYAFFYVQNNIDFVSHEIKGLEAVAEVEGLVFNIQKLRSMLCVDTQDIRLTDDMEMIKDNISEKVISLRENLFLIKCTPLIKNELLGLIDSVEKSSLEYSSFEYLSEVIEKFRALSKEMSFHFNLVLDSELNSYVLIDNVVHLLPELIEYNGQIRAVASSLKDSCLSDEQKRHIIIQLDRIQDRLNKIDYNMLMLYKTEENMDIRLFHKKMVEAQNIIIDFTKNELLKSDKISIEANGIFMLLTDNINLIIDLYNANLNILRDDLEVRLMKNKELSFYIILSGLISVLFILYLYKIFYFKNKEYIEEIGKLSITDSLTELYNRRHFDEVLESSLNIQQRTKQTFAFIILDIDFFKQYNDTYGHQAGDVAIKIVAKNLKNSLKRAGDMAFRLGGEEFGILCMGMNSTEVLPFANSIREKIEKEEVEHKNNTVSKYLTISMGVFIIGPNVISSASEIYKYADKALYKAKENGRNQVVVYDEKTFS